MAMFGIEYDLRAASRFGRGGYVVMGHWMDDDGLLRWHPLRNFGDHEGEARAFKYNDCPELDLRHLQMLAKRFDWDVVYRRVKAGRFRREQWDGDESAEAAKNGRNGETYGFMNGGET